MDVLDDESYGLDCRALPTELMADRVGSAHLVNSPNRTGLPANARFESGDAPHHWEVGSG